ncbi:nickel pincer cofactor biosynthesis protein LarC [Clostridiales bacterium COT073_COT-073]|nr:nickel pincer cofactor biosynthesis protein LarC [Clostridiales bacterium COT073_COT-073]
MKTLYLDCFSGLSGNMFLAAMIELGVDFEFLKSELSKLHLDDEFVLELSKVNKNGIACHYLDVILKKEEHLHAHHHHGEEECCHHHAHDHAHHHGAESSCDDQHHHNGESSCGGAYHHEKDCCCGHRHDYDQEGCDGGHLHAHHQEGCCDDQHDHDHSHQHHHRNLYDIHKIIEESDLSLRVQELAKSIFGFVARAESRVHGKPLSEVHFHEVGAIDSIVDIVGAAICIDALGIEKIMASSIATGTGFVNCAHGLMPLPAPATVEILKEAAIPFYSAEVKGELLTPTGAAILAAFVSEYNKMPAGLIRAIGYGAGRRNHAIPNVVRACLLDEDAAAKGNRSQLPLPEGSNQVMEIRFQIDDMTGEELGFFMELAMTEGAKDCYFQPIYMKKNRPATEVVLLVETADLNRFSHMIFKHTSTLGFRYLIWPRQEMKRQSFESNLAGEPYRVKIAEWQDVQKISYEYEDIKRIAIAQNKTLQEIINEISFSVFESIQQQAESGQIAGQEQEK